MSMCYLHLMVQNKILKIFITKESRLHLYFLNPAMSKYYIYLLLCLLVFARCEDKVEEKVYEVADVPPPPVAIDLYSPEVDSIFGLLSLDEKINELWQYIA